MRANKACFARFGCNARDIAQGYKYFRLLLNILLLKYSMYAIILDTKLATLAK